MSYRSIIGTCVLAAASLLVVACDENPAADVAKAQKEAKTDIAKAQGDANEKIGKAQGEANEKIKDAVQDMNKEMAAAQADVAKELRELETALRDAKKETQADFSEYAKKRTRLLELQAMQVKARATTATGAVKTEVDAGMKDFDVKYEAFKTSLKDLDKVSADKWAATKAKVDADFKELEESVANLGKKL